MYIILEYKYVFSWFIHGNITISVPLLNITHQSSKQQWHVFSIIYNHHVMAAFPRTLWLMVCLTIYLGFKENKLSLITIHLCRYNIHDIRRGWGGGGGVGLRGSSSAIDVLNFESVVRRTVLFISYQQPNEVILAQFSLFVHKTFNVPHIYFPSADLS